MTLHRDQCQMLHPRGITRRIPARTVLYSLRHTGRVDSRAAPECGGE